MRLIVEQIEKPEFVTEANAHGGKDWYICGKYIIGEEKNKNGRLYPINVLEDSVQKYITEKVNEGLAYGELGHPNGPTVNLDRSSHRILSLQQRGNVFEGKSIITNTPHGNTAKGLLESGGKLGVSTRGMGSLQEKNGAMEVQKDFRLSSIDIVADPSGPGCFVNGLMEGVEYFFDKGTWREERIEELAKQAKRMTKEERGVKALAIFEAYFGMLVEGTKDSINHHMDNLSKSLGTNEFEKHLHNLNTDKNMTDGHIKKIAKKVGGYYGPEPSYKQSNTRESHLELLHGRHRREALTKSSLKALDSTPL